MSVRPARAPQNKFPSRLSTIFFSSHHNLTSKRKVQLIHSEPNVFLIEDFLSSSELHHIDQLITANEAAFSKSYTEGGDNKKVVSDERTSNFFHLTKSQDRVVRNIEQRAADMVGMNVQHVEPLQIVRYTKDQKFGLHHDSGTLLDSLDVEPVHPVRFVTFFVYLNTLPLGLGSTDFPRLGLQVHPQRGSAVLFCNILPDYRPDPRTTHQALPVRYPDLWKYGMNIWISSANQQAFAQQPSGVRLQPKTSLAGERRERGGKTERAGMLQPSTVLAIAEEQTRRFSAQNEVGGVQVSGNAHNGPRCDGGDITLEPRQNASCSRQEGGLPRKRKAADTETDGRKPD